MSEAEDLPLIKILAIDGGGARGVIPAVVLDALERGVGERRGKKRVPVHKLFDVVAGTSTGSLITSMLTTPKSGSKKKIATAAEIGDYYMGPAGKLFFTRSKEYEKKAATGQIPAYPAESHKAGIRGAISKRALLSEARTNVALTVYNLVDDPPRTYTFTRWKARHGRDGTPPEDHEFPMWEVVRGASVFPGIFPGFTLSSVGGLEYHPLDGGMFAINPVLDGLAHSIRLLANLGLNQEPYRFLVISLGTGFFNVDFEPDEVNQWGTAQWFTGSKPLPPVVQVLFEGQTDSADMLMKDIRSKRGRIRHYYRFQPEMKADYQLDDVDPKTLKTLRGYAETMVRERADEISGICDLLAEGRALPDR